MVLVKILPLSLYRLNKPVFVIGCSRSGTTAFIEHYQHHKDLCNWSEASQIVETDLYNPSIDHLKTSEDLLFRDHARIKFLFGIRTVLTGKKRFINKLPENSLRIDYIQKIFPDAKFIHIIREGHATVESNFSRSNIDLFRTYCPFGYFPKPPDWRSYLKLPKIEQYSRQWVDVITYIQNKAKTLNTENYLEIKYEEFCKDPHTVFKEIDNFCEISPDRRLLNKLPETLPNFNFKWKKNLTEDEIMKLESIINDLNHRLGYS